MELLAAPAIHHMQVACSSNSIWRHSIHSSAGHLHNECADSFNIQHPKVNSSHSGPSNAIGKDTELCEPEGDASSIALPTCAICIVLPERAASMPRGGPAVLTAACA